MGEAGLMHLLGLEELAEGDRGRLFAAWRLFFERCRIARR